MIIINTYKTFPSAVPHTTVLIDALELTYTAEEVTVSITGLFTINVLIDALELTYTAEEVTVPHTTVLIDALELTYLAETVSVSIIKTATNQILPGNNNAEEIPPTMDLGSSDLELGLEVGLQQVGMRFTNLTIPRESTILNANIQFSCDETSSSALTLIIEGEASDNPGIFDSGSSNISSRVRTTNNVSWVPDPWTVVQRRSDAEKTPDISSIIQEIVNRETYQPTDGIVIFIESTGGTGKRTAESSNGTSSDAPTITINYLVGDLPSVTTLIETLTLTYEILEFGVDVGASNEAKPGILQLTYSSPELFVEAFDSVIFLSDYGDDTDTNHVVVGNAIIARNPDLIIHGGDTYPSGAPSDAIAGYSIFQDYIDDEKFLHISGNHDLDYTTTLASLTLGSTIFSLGSAWKFHSLPNATPFPNNWKLTSFDDTSWSGGTGNFGYGDAQNTILDFGGDSLNKYTNYLFRKTVNYSAVTSNGLVLQLHIDDGAEVYINGTLIYTFNMDYPLTEASFALLTINTSSNTSVYTENGDHVIRVPSSVLQSGENQIAVLVKQDSLDSSDVAFDMALHNYTFPSVGVFGSRPFYANGYGDGIRSIAPYLPPYLEQYSVVNNNIEFFFLTSGRRSGDGLIASPTMQYSYSQGANWLKYALGDSTALVKILITHDTPVTRISGKNRDYFDYLINNPEYPLDAIIHGDAHVSSVFKHNETGFKVIDASNFRDSSRGDSTFTQASNPTQWTNNFIDTTDENNLFLEIRNTNYGARVQFLDVSNNVAFETEITPTRYVPPTLRLIYTVETVVVNTDPIQTISGLVVDLNDTTMFNASGTTATEGQEIYNWVNAVNDNGVTGATQYRTGRYPIMQTVNGNKEVKFNGSTTFLEFEVVPDLHFETTDSWSVLFLLGSVAGDGPMYHKGGFGNRHVGIFNFGGFESYTYHQENTIASNILTNEVGAVDHNGGTRQMRIFRENVTELDYTNLGTVTNTQNTLIGARQNNGSDNTSWAFFYGGSIRRMLVFNRVLTSEERTTIYNELKGNIFVYPDTLELTYTAEEVTVSFIPTDVDALAFITAVGTLDATQEEAIDNLVIGLKANGTWTKYQAIYPFIGGTASSHKWNLKNPLDTDGAFRLGWNGTITHDANGIKGDGSTGYANTFFIPTNVLTFNSETLSVYSVTNTTPIKSDAIEIGSFSSASQASLMAIKGGATKDLFQSRLDGALLITTNTDARGYFTASKNGDTTLRLFKNGNIVGSSVSAGSLGVLPQFILALNLFGSPFSDSYVNQTLGFTTIGDGLSDTEVANDYTVIQAYQTALGRQV